MRTVDWTTLTVAMLMGAASCEGGSTGADEGGTGIVDSGKDDGDDDGMPATSGTGSMDGAEAPAEDTASTMPLDDEGSDEGPIPEPPIKFDLGEIADAPDVDTACRKVDFLFVIDNSGSMGTSQGQLVSNFPVFIDGIQSTLDSVVSYQVGVVTSDNYTYNAPGCNGLSSLVVQTGGFQSSNAVCGPYADGFNFMTEADDLAETFSCAAQIGTSGSGTELVMQAVEEAVSRVEGGPGECNEGFIRDDALLVIVIITDESDGPIDTEPHSPGDANSWYDTVVAAKLGIPENVVVMSLIKYAGGPCPPLYSWENGQEIADFTALFGPNGFVGGICEADYGPLFDEAIGIIDEACENFVPIG